jgi:hypothetical protein
VADVTGEPKRLGNGAAAILLGLLTLLTGCVQPSEGDRRLNNQNIKAGEYVEKTATQPEVIQAGKDVKENSLALETALELKPKVPEAYTPAKSKEGRKQSEEEHATSPFWAVLGGIGSAALGWLLRGGALRLFASIAPVAAGGPLGAVASILIEGVAKIRQKAQESEDQKVSETDMLEILGPLAKDAGVQGLIDKLREKIEPRVTQLL